MGAFFNSKAPIDRDLLLITPSIPGSNLLQSLPSLRESKRFVRRHNIQRITTWGDALQTNTIRRASYVPSRQQAPHTLDLQYLPDLVAIQDVF